MKVYFFRSERGPAPAPLITVRGAKDPQPASSVLSPDHWSTKEMLVHCRADARIIDTAKLSLNDQETHYADARDHGFQDVARLHSGDPSIYGAIAEQMHSSIAWELNMKWCLESLRLSPLPLS